MARILDGALLGLVIDMDDAKAFGISHRPFEVIHHRPLHVSADVGSSLHCREQRHQVVVQVINASLIVNLTVIANAIVVCRTIFSDVNRFKELEPILATEFPLPEYEDTFPGSITTVAVGAAWACSYG